MSAACTLRTVAARQAFAADYDIIDSATIPQAGKNYRLNLTFGMVISTQRDDHIAIISIYHVLGRSQVASGVAVRAISSASQFVVKLPDIR